MEAVFAALNRDEIIAGAYGDGMAESANSIFSNVNTFYDPSVEGYTQDVEKAKQLVKETGLDSKTLTLYFNSERVYMKESRTDHPAAVKERGDQSGSDPAGICRIL